MAWQPGAKAIVDKPDNDARSSFTEFGQRVRKSTDWGWGRKIEKWD